MAARKAAKEHSVMTRCPHRPLTAHLFYTRDHFHECRLFVVVIAIVVISGSAFLEEHVAFRVHCICSGCAAIELRCIERIAKIDKHVDICHLKTNACFGEVCEIVTLSGSS